MSYTPTSGRYAKASTPYGVLPGVNWKLSGDGKPADASNWRDGRRRENTLEDGTLTLDLVWDAGDSPSKVAGYNLRLGTKVDVNCYVDGSAAAAPTKYFVFPGIITNINPESAVEGQVVRYPITLMLNGAITYPE